MYLARINRLSKPPWRACPRFTLYQVAQYFIFSPPQYDNYQEIHIRVYFFACRTLDCSNNISIKHERVTVTILKEWNSQGQIAIYSSKMFPYDGHPIFWFFRCFRMAYHCAGTVVTLLEFALGYMLMLAFMMGNIWLCILIVATSGLTYFFTFWTRVPLRKASSRPRYCMLIIFFQIQAHVIVLKPWRQQLSMVLVIKITYTSTKSMMAQFLFSFVGKIQLLITSGDSDLHYCQQQTNCSN